eukprot:7402498-Ditylum_brightwellii.AAC.1
MNGKHCTSVEIDNQWVPNITWRASPCNSHDPKKYGLFIGPPMKFFGRSQLECDELTKTLYLTFNHRLPEELRAHNLKHFQNFYGIATKPFNKRMFYTVYAANQKYAEALFQAATPNGTPMTFSHYGVKSLLAKQPTTEKRMNDIAKQYKVIV